MPLPVVVGVVSLSIVVIVWAVNQSSSNGVSRADATTLAHDTVCMEVTRPGDPPDPVPGYQSCMANGGIIAAPDTVVTAYSAISGATTVSVFTYGGQVIDATLAGFDLSKDVAVLPSPASRPHRRCRGRRHCRRWATASTSRTSRSTSPRSSTRRIRT